MRTLWMMISLSFAADRKNALLLCFTLPLGWLAPAIVAYATKLVVDAATTGSAADGLFAGGAAAGSVVLTVGAMVVAIFAIHALGKQTEAHLDQRIGRLVTGLAGIEHYERPDYLDRLQLLREQSGVIGAGLNAAVQLSAAACQIGVVCLLLAAQQPWLLLLFGFAVPSLAGSALARRLVDRAQERTAEADRLQHRLVAMVSELPVGREARLFGLGDELTRRRHRLADRVHAHRNRADLAGNAIHLAGRALFGLGYVGATWLVLHRAASGDTSPGAVAMIIVLAGQIEGCLAGLVNGVQFVQIVHQVTRRMRWLEDYGSRHGSHGTQRPPTQLRAGIALEHVGFCYGDGAPVLDDVTVELPAGAVVALVGDNGAGKSTLIKLLLGLYVPAQGRITVDGSDLRQLDIGSWRRRIAAAFQDYVRPEFLLSEAIGLGDVSRLDDRAALVRAADAGDAAGVVEARSTGWATQLGAAWPGGVDLSGGQWQRLAIARGQMRPDPLLLLLDEPTAALDAATEHALFERYARLTHSRHGSGGVTLLVSHRFSTVRSADLILVLDDGRIRERGTHEQLMRKHGLYAELYGLQASGYACGSDAP